MTDDDRSERTTQSNRATTTADPEPTRPTGPDPQSTPTATDPEHGPPLVPDMRPTGTRDDTADADLYMALRDIHSRLERIERRLSGDDPSTTSTVADATTRRMGGR